MTHINDIVILDKYCVVCNGFAEVRKFIEYMSSNTQVVWRDTNEPPISVLYKAIFNENFTALYVRNGQMSYDYDVLFEGVMSKIEWSLPMYFFDNIIMPCSISISNEALLEFLEG